MNEQDLVAWCSLWRAPGVGVKTFYQIVAAFGSPQAFFNASASEINKHLANVSSHKRQSWLAAKDTGRQDVDWLQAGDDHHIVTLADDHYPPLLKTIADAPPILFARGEVALLQLSQIAVVGSRNATTPGLTTCKAFVKALCQQGWAISSGLALGIDASAHQAALDAGGKTIAVVATGLDRVYPAKNRQLAYEIVDKGVMVSEFPLGTGVRAGHFPRRNRLISGLSSGVLVVEASVKSGSLITARMAAEQGREVFAIPGSIHHPLAKGCHHLIKQGAKLVESAQDIVEELSAPIVASGITLGVASGAVPNGELVEHEQAARVEASKHQRAETPVSTSVHTESVHADPDSQAILDLMGYDPCHIDDLVSHSTLTSAEISAMLLMLELDGWIESLAGGMFQRVK